MTSMLLKIDVKIWQDPVLFQMLSPYRLGQEIETIYQESCYRISKLWVRVIFGEIVQNSFLVD